MSKAKILCLVLTLVMALSVVGLAACTGQPIKPFERPTEDLNVYLDLPEGDLTTANTSAIDNLFIAHKILLQSPGFYGHSHGFTTAVGIKQEVDNARYVVGDFDNKQVFKQMVTKGVVSNAYQLFLLDNDYIYRASDKVKSVDDVVWKSSAEPIDEDSFYSDFGHRFDKLTGYVLNYDTVVSGELVEKVDGLYTYHYVLDADAASVYLRREMITNGNLSGDPVFSKAEIYVTMDAEWNIKSLRTDCAYKAHTMGINASCSEDITEEFQPYDGQLPNYDFFEPYFGQTGGGLTKETTALDVLMKIFEPYLGGGEVLQVALTAKTFDQQIASGLVSISGLDISDLSNLTVSARFGELNVDYVNGDGAIYLKYQDFQGSTTVDGITELIDTLTSIIDGQSDDGSLLGDIDVEQLLDGLTYSISNDKTLCVVNLPVEIANLAINANLYASVDGDNYTFTGANISIGDVNITIAPQNWTVAQRTGAYPEILGLADLVKNGTLALQAQISLPLNGRSYDIDADAQFDLATMNGAVNVDLGSNGTVSIVLVDNVAYLNFGEVKAKCDLTNIDSLLQVVDGFTSDLGALDVTITNVLDLLSGITATEIQDGGVTLNLNIGGVDLALNLTMSNDRWQIGGLTANSDSFTATVLPSEYQGKFAAPEDGDSYADITELVETFAEPILNLINGNGFGVTLNLKVTTGGRVYSVYLNAKLDIRGTLNIDVKVYENSVGILSAEVYYARNTVYLTLDGINVAFKVDGDSTGSADIADTIDQLMQSEQLQAVLNSNEQLQAVVDEITALISDISAISIDQLLDTDLSAIITRFEFDGNVLGVSLDGTALGLEGKVLNLAFSNRNGRLAVQIDGINVAGIILDTDVTLYSRVPIIILPNIDNYIFSLHGEVMGAEVDATFDIVHMDIWATVHINNEMAYLRYVGGNIYVKYGAAAVKFDATNLGSAIEKISALLGATSDGGILDNVDIEALLSAINFDLTSAKPSITFTQPNFVVALNFDRYQGYPYFNDLTVKFNVEGNKYSAKFVKQRARADKLDVDGQFVDGNILLDQILDTIEAYSDIQAFSAQLAVDITVADKAYTVDITVNYNEGIYATLVLKDKLANLALLSAEIYFVDNTLYFDVNGIRQAVELPDSDGGNEIDFAQIIETLTQIDGVSEIIEQITSAIKQLPEVITNATISDVFSALYHDDNGNIVIGIDLGQFDLGKFTVTLGLGNNITLDVDSITVGDVTVKLSASLLNDSEPVVAPDVNTYINELKITLGDITAIAKLDLYRKAIDGQLVLDESNTVAFKYVDGNIYLTYGNIGAKLALSDLPTVLEQIGKLVSIPQLPDTDSGDLLATAMEWLNKVAVQRVSTTDGYTLEVAIDGTDIAISVNFTCTDTTASIDSINLSVDGETPVEAVAEFTSGQTYPQIDVNGNFVDVCELLTNFVDPIVELINANGYSIGIDNLLIKLGDTLYGVSATVELQITEQGVNVHVNFKLSVDNTLMLDGEIWLVDNVLYVSAGDLKLAVELDSGDAAASPDSGAITVDSIKETLTGIKGYNTYLDQIVDLVLDLTSLSLDEISIEQLVTLLKVDNRVLTAIIDGEQLGVSEFLVVIGAKNNGLSVALANIEFADVAIDLVANVAPYTGAITLPNDDFTTNLVIEIDENNTVYANIDLISGVIRMQLVSQTASGNTTLDILYSIDTNIIKLTNGKELNVSIDVNSIADIVDEINNIVNEFAGADPETPLPGLDGLDDINLQEILASMQLSVQGGKVQIALSALGMDITAIFAGGTVDKVVIPLMEATDGRDGLTLTVKLASNKANYATFSDNDADYVRIDQVFNDFYYGYKDDDGFGTIQNLIYTNSWKFDFNANSSIDVTNDDGTTNKYEIVAGSYLAFYYNKTDLENIKLRAKLNVLKDGKEFIILDLAYIDGRLYVVYDSNSSNSNDLRATVAVSAIEECIELLPALIKVVPQIGDLIEDLNNSLSNAESSLTLGNLASIFQSASYSNKTFSLTLNGGVIDSLGEISLSVTDNIGTLTLNALQLEYGSVAINLQNITVSASGKNDAGEFEYVNDYILSYYKTNGKGVANGQSSNSGYDIANDHGYDMSNHMNVDSIRELLVAFIITADNVDDNGNRSFKLEGSINATLLGNKAIIGITIVVDIDADNNVYLGVKLSRDASGILSGAIYSDDGGYSYLLLNGKEGTISLYRNSYSKYTYCSRCGNWNCTSSILHAIWRKSYTYLDTEAPVGNKLPSYIVQDITMKDFTADTKTMVGYILDTVYFGSLIDSQIRNAIGKENTNVYGVEDILKSYTYTFNSQSEMGTFAILADLKPIDSALGEITANIVHVGNFDNVEFDENGDFNSSGVSLTKIHGTAEMISIMNATYEVNLVTPTSGLAQQYVEGHNYLW